MAGIVAAGVYVPAFRLDRRGLPTPAKGTRAVAHHDEDTTTMGVEAARRALAAAGEDRALDALAFATTAPAYVDKTNATAVHAALGLAPAMLAFDAGGAPRSAAGSLLAALRQPGRTLAVSSDLRVGPAGGADEREGGDAAATLLVTGGEEPVIAELLGAASETAEFLERWRLPGETGVQQWEPTFGEQVYGELGALAVTRALAAAGVRAGDVDHLAIAASNARAARRVARASGIAPERVVADGAGDVGYAGAAQLGLGIAAALAVAEPGETIVALSLADGADSLVLRATDLLPGRRPRGGARDAASAPRVDYPTYLLWRGLLRAQRMRRPAPGAPLAPAALRAQAWKYGFGGSRCRVCGLLHLPPQRVCLGCRAADEMDAERVDGVTGTVANATVDRLAWAEHPPTAFAIVDFDGGGRAQLEATEIAEAELRHGLRVSVAFRRRWTTEGVHNYFWKAVGLEEDD